MILGSEIKGRVLLNAMDILYAGLCNQDITYMLVPYSTPSPKEVPLVLLQLCFQNWRLQLIAFIKGIPADWLNVLSQVLYFIPFLLKRLCCFKENGIFFL